MGVGCSDFSRDEDKESSWLVEHGGFGSPWSHFTLRRYGAGFAATGVSTSVALPRLLRRRLQDWNVKGCSVHLGEHSVSFGRQLESRTSTSRPTPAELFYGVDIFFGDNSSRASWVWYCRPSEWLLQLHHAVLEPLPQPAPTTAATHVGGVGAGQRWPGRPRYLGEEPGQAGSAGPDSVPSSSNVEGQPQPDGVGGGGGASAEESAGAAAVPCVDGACAAEAGGGDDAAATSASNAGKLGEGALDGGACGTEELISHQLSLFLSNADGHVGLLCLPVPHGRVDVTAAAVARWRGQCEVPLFWAGRRWRSSDDFRRLRESALNMPDLLLLGLETELAMALTPDWTWEKYPRGFGEAALPEADEEDAESDGEAEAVAAVQAQMQAEERGRQE
eukprot:TRINITY_DN38012_c0_g1_i1.p1 TRINITY_DN38012_c0_g1~~TRINITY_DN38012_c0_g1_i1.p1  ORF type:complete len:434 (-),score=97.88 TRINITY_DN38012_c0_g1_i1:67-1236(-)